MNHYVYKITDPKTGQYYIGVRSCDCDPQNDTYMGSYYTWKPKDNSRLEKEILKSDFKTREEANEFEHKLIKENIDNELNENYHDTKNFYCNNKGINNPFYNKTHSDETKQKISESRKLLFKNNKINLSKENHPNWKGGKTYCPNCGNRKNSEASLCINCSDRSGKNNPMYNKKRTKKWKRNQSKKVRGSKNSNSKLSEKDVIFIKKNIENKTLKYFANKFNVSQTTISLIKNGKRWKHIKIN